MKEGPRNAVRIIAGAWRRQLIRFPSIPDLRPTPDRVRETLFNWLGQTLHGKSCLDLFAGSGALGLEAASRGAAPVVLVESVREAQDALLENATRLDARAVRLERIDAIEFLARADQFFDVVFLDPPFRRGVDKALLDLVGRRLNPRGTVYVESDHPFKPPQGWRIMRQSRAGQVHFHLLDRSPLEEPG